MFSLIISRPSNPKDSEELDLLLWEILRKPLSLPKNIRDKFKLTGETIELVAKWDEILVGSLVVNWISSSFTLKILSNTCVKKKKMKWKTIWEQGNCSI